MSILVVGGAGYIGAHVVRLLTERGDDVVVVDDLSTSSPQRVGDVPLVRLDIATPDAVDRLTDVIASHGVTAVIHFAARKQVGESVAKPLWYVRQNIGGMVNLLDAMMATGVGQFIFSSSAAVYGEPPTDVVPESTDPHPINPYGQTKFWGEKILEASASAWDLRFIALRYFNVAGAGWPELGDGAIMNLIPMVFEKLEAGQAPKIFGDDYPTPDGTCIRDYVHVLDLAKAHLVALDALAAGAESAIYNVGTGAGSSVREVVDEVAAVTGLDFTPEVMPRRPGDPPQLIADARAIKADLGFVAEHDLHDMVESAWRAWRLARDARD